ncbi:DUF1097 family protein [Dyadobacter arcticus]|uniref:Uncharacterized protein n=1 Tax=Dyadobacter arcticus TaxID=1078754 RepID=A0ABX0UT28_9BACT|nr:hypothetical protein [Dyadobacter arcticus]
MDITWVLFLAWTSYYLFGQDIKSSLLIYIQQMLGISIAIVIICYGNYLERKFGPLLFHCSVTVIMVGVYFTCQNFLPL